VRREHHHVVLGLPHFNVLVVNCASGGLVGLVRRTLIHFDSAVFLWTVEGVLFYRFQVSLVFFEAFQETAANKDVA